jgi:phytoene dehydrogenase-like protein
VQAPPRWSRASSTSTDCPARAIVGLLDDRIVSDLQLAKRGLEVFVADPQLWVPFDDGTAFAQWLDEDRTVHSLKEAGFTDKDIAGAAAYEEMFDSMRRMLRTGPRDTWVGDSPDRAELEDLLGNDPFLIDVLFNASISDVLDNYVSDQRLKDALFGQGVIGTYAGPRDPGTASVKLMHFAGRARRTRRRMGLRPRRDGHDQFCDRRRRPGGGGCAGRRGSCR